MVRGTYGVEDTIPDMPDLRVSCFDMPPDFSNVCNELHTNILDCWNLAGILHDPPTTVPNHRSQLWLRTRGWHWKASYCGGNIFRDGDLELFNSTLHRIPDFHHNTDKHSSQLHRIEHTNTNTGQTKIGW